MRRNVGAVGGCGAGGHVGNGWIDMGSAEYDDEFDDAARGNNSK